MILLRVITREGDFCFVKTYLFRKFLIKETKIEGMYTVDNKINIIINI